MNCVLVVYMYIYRLFQDPHYHDDYTNCNGVYHILYLVYDGLLMKEYVSFVYIYLCMYHLCVFIYYVYMYILAHIIYPLIALPSLQPSLLQYPHSNLEAALHL